MSSSITMKPNPFQRSNPFQVQGSYQPTVSTSFAGYHAKPSYRPSYQAESYLQKQNSFSKKSEHQLWKFRQDNCAKAKVFNQTPASILHEKYLQEKNSFQKELVLSSVGRRNHNASGNGQHVNNNYGQQAAMDKGPIENPFGRKYLMSVNALAESQVYTGYTGGVTGQQNLPTYQRYKTQYDIYTPNPQPTNVYSYSNYTQPPAVQDNYMNKILTNIGSNSNLQTSLNHNNNQYASRKSIERQSSYNRNNGSYNNMNAVESRYSLDRDNRNKYVSVESNKDIYPAYLNGNNNAANNSRSSIPLAERDRQSRVYSRANVKQENVKFEHSDQEDSRTGSKQKQRQPTFGSKKDIPSLPGPQQITVKGMKFYRQKVLCY